MRVVDKERPRRDKELVPLPTVAWCGPGSTACEFVRDRECDVECVRVRRCPNLGLGR